MPPAKRKLAPQEVLFNEGEPTKSFYVVLSGVLSLYNDRSGRAVEKSRVQSSSVIGELSFTHPEPRPMAVRAVTESEVVEFSFEQIQAEMKSLPGWTQIMLKSLSEQLHTVGKEVKITRNEEASTGKLSTDDVLKGTASLRLAMISLESTNDGWEWEKIREYGVQVFQVPALKLEPIVRTFAQTGWLKLQEGAEGPERIESVRQDVISDFEAFLRRYRHSRARGMIEPTQTDCIGLRALCVAAEGKPESRHGSVTVSLTEALRVAQSLPEGTAFRVDQFDLLITRGLDMKKESLDGGVSIAFNREECTKVLSYWNVLMSLPNHS